MVKPANFRKKRQIAGWTIAISLVLAGCSITRELTVRSHESPLRAAVDATAVSSLSQCAAEPAAIPLDESNALDPDAIHLLNWNIRKGTMKDWKVDLAALAENKELVLIQEASDQMSLEDPFKDRGYWSFTPGFRTRQGYTGVATFSRVHPLYECHLTVQEPWLRTPKTINVTSYAMKDTASTLLVVNLHMINFSIGMTDFREQLALVANQLSLHQGPVIVAGDFNTWRAARRRAVNDVLVGAGLQPINFLDDQRTRFFGSELDHAYARGLVQYESATRALHSSDHNPMTMRLGLVR